MKTQTRLNRLFLLIIAVIFKSLFTDTAKPCPTNKIAPHRRIGIESWSPVKQRTFGSVFGLFHDEGSPSYAGSQLQENPQEDDPDDCGDIEDYDETDVSSATQAQTQRLRGDKNRFFFGNFFNKPSNEPPVRPIKPQARPPAGGYFGGNSYRPQPLQDPSDNVKPVHEPGQEPQAPYRPGIVGGPSGHVIAGVPPKPNRYPQIPQTQRPIQDMYNRPNRYRPGYTTRRPRMRHFSDSVVGSFIDLLF